MQTVKAVVRRRRTGEIMESNAYRMDATGAWRMTVRVKQLDRNQPTELRGFLQNGNDGSRKPGATSCRRCCSDELTTKWHPADDVAAGAGREPEYLAKIAKIAKEEGENQEDSRILSDLGDRGDLGERFFCACFFCY